MAVGLGKIAFSRASVELQGLLQYLLPHRYDGAYKKPTRAGEIGKTGTCISHFLYISYTFPKDSILLSLKISTLLESFLLLFLPFLLDFAPVIKKGCICVIFLNRFKVVKFTE